MLPADLDGGDEVAKACDIPKLALMASTRMGHFVMATRPTKKTTTTRPMSPGVIEVEFTTGARLRIRGPVDVPIVAAVMQALTDCGKR